MKKRGPVPRDWRVRFWKYVMPEPNSGCWLWTGGVNHWGYGWLGISFKQSKLAHRLSWVLHHGDIPDNLWVLHKCDVPSCVNPTHLFLGTHQDNMDDMKKKGRGRYTKSAAKLTPNEVSEIRTGDGSTRYLAKKFGVGKSTIQAARAYKSWKELA
jgi:hypothetical protein